MPTQRPRAHTRTQNSKKKIIKQHKKKSSPKSHTTNRAREKTKVLTREKERGKKQAKLWLITKSNENKIKSYNQNIVTCQSVRRKKKEKKSQGSQRETKEKQNKHTTKQKKLALVVVVVVACCNRLHCVCMFCMCPRACVCVCKERRKFFRDYFDWRKKSPSKKKSVCNFLNSRSCLVACFNIPPLSYTHKVIEKIVVCGRRKLSSE